MDNATNCGWTHLAHDALLMYYATGVSPVPNAWTSSAYPSF